ncbi:MAG: hypothetical protein Q9186_003359 [Xanthomendoza sp. 1 TL-2023]
MARSGAVVNTTVLGQNETVDLIQQIDTRFAPNYVTENTIGWNASNTLFSLFLGINDVDRSWRQQNSNISDAVFRSYLTQLEKLYEYGARSFLLHNVPPVNRGGNSKEPDRTIEGRVISSFNNRTMKLFTNFTSAHNDISVLLFDTHQLFSQAMEDPTVWPQTANIKNTTGSCEAYESGDVPSMDYSDPSCPYAVNEYFWLNGLHPTYPVHEALAAQVALALAYNS